MKKGSTSQIYALGISLLFFILGLSSLWYISNYLNFVGDITPSFIILLPVLTYLILAGKIGELKGPGGLEAKFIKTGKAQIEPDLEIKSWEDLEIVEKSGGPLLKSIQDKIVNLDDSKPIILTLTVGSNRYDAGMVLNYVKALSQYKNFRFIVLLDFDERFVAYVQSQSMLQILENIGLGNEFITKINEGDIRDIQLYPGVITRTIDRSTSNIEALREMTEKNMSGLLVVDNKKIVGVVEREQISSKLLLALSE
jgi:hypothetical protein